LVRHGAAGAERPGILDSCGVIRDVSGLVRDWTPELLSATEMARWSRLDTSEFPVVPSGTRLGMPVTGVRKFLGIGMNFHDFAREAGRAVPAEPALFSKAISSLTGPDDDVILPRASVKTDWEVELGVVIGRTARCVDAGRALEYVAGYCLVNDLSEREFQNERGGTWDKGKGCDTFGPIGPWLVSADEIPDPQGIDLWLEVNGRRYQNGNTREMIFPISELVACVSCYMTLEPGDILTTGTPAGVGSSVKPVPVYLQPGDVMRLGSSRLGVQNHRVVAWPDPVTRR
jgi:2-keto-4-pentenoate hydratase/2-oxohepta-3-ene-1,7-dioic acid hydratase in catechol pathway